MTEQLAVAIIIAIVVVAYVWSKFMDDRRRRAQGLDVEPWPWDRWRNH